MHTSQLLVPIPLIHVHVHDSPTDYCVPKFVSGYIKQCKQYSIVWLFRSVKLLATLMIDSIIKPWACNGLSAVKTFMGFISHKEALFNLVLVTIHHNSELSYVFGRHKGHTTPALLRSEDYKIVLSKTIISFQYRIHFICIICFTIIVNICVNISVFISITNLTLKLPTTESNLFAPMYFCLLNVNYWQV